MIYDFDNVVEIDRNISLADIADATRDYFDAPTSILTQCATAPDEDLKEIWTEAFNG
jgi:hypothetical protein